MTFVMVGNPGAQCILVLSQAPVIGETITIEEHTVRWPLTSPARLLPCPGKSYKVVKQLQDFDSGAGFLGVLPWYLLELNEKKVDGDNPQLG
jgi:hypothetical protein